MAKSYSKYIDVDILSVLEEKMKGNTRSYQSDFEIDRKMIMDIAISNRSEDKTLLWLSRPHGTHCQKECEVFVKGSASNKTWTYFADYDPEDIVACAVEVVGVKNNIVRGNIYELDYQKHVAQVKALSVLPATIEKTFEDGYVDTVPFERSSYGHYYNLVEEHGAIVYSLTLPQDREALATVLAQQKSERASMKTGLEKKSDISLESASDSHFNYLVVVRVNDENIYFPSNSRDSIKHMIENEASICWVYDKNGWWVSFAELDKETGKAYHPKMLPDGEPRQQYAEMLKKFNMKAKPSLSDLIDEANLNKSTRSADQKGVSINREKLKVYLEEEMILEFASAEECRAYFNTYDGQAFATVAEMKSAQGPYGFGLDGKWYHINFDEALDVREKPRTVDFGIE